MLLTIKSHAYLTKAQAGGLFDLLPKITTPGNMPQCSKTGCSQSLGFYLPRGVDDNKVRVLKTETGFKARIRKQARNKIGGGSILPFLTKSNEGVLEPP